MWALVSFCHNYAFDRQTDGRTDRQTDRQKGLRNIVRCIAYSRTVKIKVTTFSDT